MCLIGDVGSEGMGSSRNYRQRLQEEHKGQAWGLLAKCWGRGGGVLSRGQEDWVAFPTHHGPWLIHECWRPYHCRCHSLSL